MRPANSLVPAPAETVLAERVTRFGRLLRGAGLKLGPAQILEGIEALSEVEVTDRGEFYWALHAAWVKRGEDRDVFREAFRLFWRQPDRPVNRVLEELLALSRITRERRSPQSQRRVLDALDDETRPNRELRAEDADVVRLAFSDVEVLRQKDFEQMSSAELQEAQRLIARFRFPVRDLETRRWTPVTGRGDIDMRRTMRASLRQGLDHIPLRWRRRKTRPPGVVALCDISGSMAGYTRMLIRFLHALSNDREQVHTFLFGTRLSNVTRALRHRDVDVALADLGARVRDWDGGTRISSCLGRFNREWSRRVLAQGASVLLITDGLDRDETGSLEGEMARLRRSARRVVWLNPLLRYANFQPQARGIRAMLPHVDDFRPVHNLVSLEALAAALGGPHAQRPRGRSLRKSLSAAAE